MNTRLKELVRSKTVEKCEACEEYSAYSWQDVDDALNIEKINSASHRGWECGHCGAYHAKGQSTILVMRSTHEARDGHLSDHDDNGMSVVSEEYLFGSEIEKIS